MSIRIVEVGRWQRCKKAQSLMMWISNRESASTRLLGSVVRDGVGVAGIPRGGSWERRESEGFYKGNSSSSDRRMPFLGGWQYE